MKRFNISPKIIPLLTGVIIGASVTGSVAFASSKFVKAVEKTVKLEINNHVVANTKMLSYGNQLYVPAKVVASKLGGKAGYDRYYNALDLTNLPSAQSNGSVTVNGNPISGAHPVIVNGVPYVPAKSLASELQMPYSWNTSTNQVNLGTNTGGVQLTKVLKYYNESGFNENWQDGIFTHMNDYHIQNNNDMQMGNIKYQYGIQFNNFGGGEELDENIYFNLNGRYQNLNGLVGVDDLSATTNVPITVSIKGDGQTLFTTTVSTGQLPQKLIIPVSGIKNLEFSVDYASAAQSNNNSLNNNIRIDFVNMILK